MTIHNKGPKAVRDRAVLLAAYKAMCREFHVPMGRRLSAAQIANMGNDALYRVTRDMYNGASVKKATHLAIKLGVAERPESCITRLWHKLLDPHPERFESHSVTREAQRA